MIISSDQSQVQRAFLQHCLTHSWSFTPCGSQLASQRSSSRGAGAVPQPAGRGCSSGLGHRCPSNMVLGHATRTCGRQTHTWCCPHTEPWCRDRDGAVAPVCHYHPVISLTCPSAAGPATAARGGSTICCNARDVLARNVSRELHTWGGT